MHLFTADIYSENQLCPLENDITVIGALCFHFFDFQRLRPIVLKETLRLLNIIKIVIRDSVNAYIYNRIMKVENCYYAKPFGWHFYVVKP